MITLTEAYCVIGAAWSLVILVEFLRHVKSSGKAFSDSIPADISPVLFAFVASAILLSAILVIAAFWPPLVARRVYLKVRGGGK